MLISATGGKRRKPSGFTLIELMVVIFIIGMAAVAVILTGLGGLPEPREVGERFAARLVMARDLAITGGRETAVVVDVGGYRIEQLKDGGWESLERATYWPEGLVVVTDIAGGPVTGGRFLFDATGFSTPGKVQIGDVRVSVGPVGKVWVGEVRVDAR